MKVWLIAPWTEVQDMIELARHAEALGFEGIMGADHAFVPRSMAPGYLYSDDGRPPIDGDMPYPDVWTTIAAMACATERLKFSTAVYVLPLRNPIEVAKALANLAQISNDRVVLGAGAGWMKEEFDVYGVDFHQRGKLLDESIEVMRKLWRGGYVAHDGPLYPFPPLQITPALQRPVPVYIGGTSKAALRRAARLGQGWIGAGNDIDEVPAILGQLAEYRAEYGRISEPFETVIAVNQPQDIDRMKRLEELGMTSAVFGVTDYTLPLADKLRAMEQFATGLMPLLA
ncbi:TIGR03619 family F420-dependent LLM class oxidoreductase [Parahaliea aestuarii]|uniref:TIGR03619 family F420-dependent LLM class oxidoreductase n=1 Tax=Parahaliea aestuarii TaxID=1852021 RepID=A0A5C8ZP99_9GAMM|nr:TIGR03619 family F420-dependent LLM class oxidoreductase [Parahaliea aestuarii]TXS89201.1 TIGR03619 family F420-dependent LLM class oxidoreductase [Parahaliea aestuarii]